MAVEGTFVCFTDGHDHFISNTIGLSKLSCYCAKPKLVMIRTATTKTATRETANVDSAATASKMALLDKFL